MLSKYLTPIPPELYFIFGEPKEGKAVYEQEGTFTHAQAWYRALRRIVGDVVTLSDVSLFVPVSRNAIHSRIEEGKLSCFKFKIKDTEPDVSPSLNRERPHTFIPVNECLLWFQEYHDRLIIREKGLPPSITAKELYFEGFNTSFDFHSKKHQEKWQESLDTFQQEYLIHTNKKALENLPESERDQYDITK